MGKLTSKGKHKVIVGNHPHTDMISELATMRSGEYKGRKWELHLKLKDQQLKTTLYTYGLLYQNIMGTANEKTAIDTHTKKKRQPKHNNKIVIKTQKKRTKEEGKKD